MLKESKRKEITRKGQKLMENNRSDQEKPKVGIFICLIKLTNLSQDI